MRAPAAERLAFQQARAERVLLLWRALEAGRWQAFTRTELLDRADCFEVAEMAQRLVARFPFITPYRARLLLGAKGRPPDGYELLAIARVAEVPMEAAFAALTNVYLERVKRLVAYHRRKAERLERERAGG